MTFANSSNHYSTIVVLASAMVASAAATCWIMKRKHDNDNGNSAFIPAELLACPYAEELKLAVALAKKAGDNMAGFLSAKGTVSESLYDSHVGVMETKSGEVDFCTKVDIQNEDMISREILRQYPNHTVIGEENCGVGRIPPPSATRPTWIIDPVDGTTNFAQGLQLTCVSIGYCSPGGTPVMGVIYAPGTGEWYLAVKGHGAFRNGVLIAQRGLTDKTLQQSVICCEFGYSRKREEIDAMLGAVSNLLETGCRAIRQLGSGCLDLCYVATGRLDIVYAGIVNEGWKPWDYCAGLVICQEAGCIMESIDPASAGKEFDLYSNSILCGVSRDLVDECRKTLLLNSKKLE